MKLELKIENRLPANVRPVIFNSDEEVKQIIIDFNFGDMLKEFVENISAEVKADPLATWIRWEGYFEKHDKDESLLTIGILYFEGRFYSRAILARDVPYDLSEPTQTGLTEMIIEYLDQLRAGHMKASRN